ncbi:hypothetical protein DAPPUDRAFT_332338 [Daphnia pulex]|uniref:Uncharacterized protein n=1 Tax=Daphnia pulex TaxID=6669 RepID=E9HPQ2_DAPPU|nr:hypothetical protein DAPPUDRAFT_332338 [Daphnia pulex]|eukprot:EFX66296.1 hypothetical protein DAPPUDRAFT_332338 [Daphnia pulex]
MKLKIACVLLLAAAAQTQLIGGYTGYPSLLPAATSLQWLPQGQPFPSIFNGPVYPHQVVNYRGIAVGSAGAPWYFYNPSASYPQTVQVSSADVKDAGANTGAAGLSRTRRQIQLRYGSGRRGRSLNEMIEPETSPDTQWKSLDATPASRTQRQIQLRYGSGRRGRSLNGIVEPETDGRDYESIDAAPSRAKRQIQLRYRSGYGGHRRGRSLNEPVQFELDRAKRQIQLRYRSSARRRHGRSLSEPWTTA